MRAFRMQVVIAVALAAVACSSETKNETVNADSTSAMSGPAPSAAPTPQAPAGPVTADLGAVDNSGVSGQVTATHGADSVQVQLTATGLKSGTQYESHIHKGACSATGAESIGDIALSNGSGSVSVATSAIGSPDQALSVDIHSGGKQVACADLPGHGAPASAATGATSTGGM